MNMRQSLINRPIPSLKGYITTICIDGSEKAVLRRRVRDHPPVYRCQGGGCTVFLDKGCLIVSTAFPAEGVSGIRSLFARCTRWLIKGLDRTGINGIYPDGISDLVVDNHKIGGPCLKQ
jgi:lipoate-protein ligase A